MSDLYRTNFGPVDDGSTDTMKAHDAWAEVQDQVRDGWLVPVAIDYGAALKMAHSLNAKAEKYRLAHPRPSDHPIDRSMMNATVVRRVVDAALGEEEQ